MFKSQATGKIDQFGSADICETHWMRLGKFPQDSFSEIFMTSRHVLQSDIIPN